MIATIHNHLTNIEKEYNVKILYACEVGSRAWGLSSPTSDYDVRFLYVHTVETYLSIDPVGTGNNRDVIELPIQDNLDIHGWELSKALRLLRKSNPSLLEWLHTPICYSENFSTLTQIRDLLPHALNIYTCIRHYINMARGNISKAQNRQDDLKLSINIIRPTLIAKWLHTFKKFPPYNMEQMIHSLLPTENIGNLLKEVIAMKVNESQGNVDLSTIMTYCHRELEQLDLYVKNMAKEPHSLTADLNTIFRQTLKEVSTSEL